jgi:hypothetical protein
MERREVEVLLFNVENAGDLKREYPELSEVEEFKDLSPSEVRFCWLVGNRTSPIFKMEKSERIKKSMSIVWGSSYKSSPKQKVKDLAEANSEEEIPEDILKGIYKMLAFNPGYRLKAKLMAEYIFETLNELIVLDPSTLQLMDIDDRKKYSDFVIKVSSELQGMIERLEGSYGIKTVDRKTKSKVLVSINDTMRD